MIPRSPYADVVDMSQEPVSGVAVHAIGDGEYCWVFLTAREGTCEYMELPGDDEVYESKEAALVAAYLAFRRRLRERVQAS